MQKADAYLARIEDQITKWEQATSLRAEREAAEAFTRSFAELSELMKQGRELPPDDWHTGILKAAALLIERRFSHPSRLGTVPNEALAAQLTEIPVFLRYIARLAEENDERARALQAAQDGETR